MKIVILASGNGSLAQSIFDAVSDGELPVEISALVSDQPNSYVLERARNSGIKTFVLEMQPNRAQWNEQLHDLIKTIQPDLVVSAGFM